MSIYIDGEAIVSGAGSSTPTESSVSTSGATLSLNASSADVFRVSVGHDVTISMTGGVGGKTTILMLTQAVGNKTITLSGTSIEIPSSATSPLAFSTTVGKVDILALRYDSVKGKWLVVSMVPGY